MSTDPSATTLNDASGEIPLKALRARLSERDDLGVVEMHRTIAWRMLREGSAVQGFQELVRACRIVPMNARLAASIVYLGLKAKTFGPALTLLSQGVDETEGDERIGVMRHLARLARKTNELERSREVLVQLLAERPNDRRARAVLNALLEREERWDELDASLEKETREALARGANGAASRAALRRARMWDARLDDHARAALRYMQAAQYAEKAGDLERSFFLRLLWLHALHRSGAPQRFLEDAVAVTWRAGERVGQVERVKALGAELGLPPPKPRRASGPLVLAKPTPPAPQPSTPRQRSLETALLEVADAAEKAGKKAVAAAVLTAAVREREDPLAVAKLEAHYVQRGAWRPLAELYRDQLGHAATPAEKARWAEKLAELLESELDDAAGAAAAWAEVVAASGDSRAATEQVRLLPRRRDSTGVRAALDAGVDQAHTDEERARALVSRAAEALTRKEQSAARADLEQALRLAPGDPHAAAGLAELAAASGDLSQLAALEAALTPLPPRALGRGDLYRRYARLAQAHLDANHAAAAWAEVLRELPADEEALSQRLALARASGDPGALVAALGAVIEQHTGSVRSRAARLELAEVLERAGRDVEAGQALEQAASEADDPHSQRALWERLVHLYRDRLHDEPRAAAWEARLRSTAVVPEPPVGVGAPPSSSSAPSLAEQHPGPTSPLPVTPSLPEPDGLSVPLSDVPARAPPYPTTRASTDGARSAPRAALAPPSAAPPSAAPPGLVRVAPEPEPAGTAPPEPVWVFPKERGRRPMTPPSPASSGPTPPSSGPRSAEPVAKPVAEPVAEMVTPIPQEARPPEALASVIVELDTPRSGSGLPPSAPGLALGARELEALLAPSVKPREGRILPHSRSAAAPPTKEALPSARTSVPRRPGPPMPGEGARVSPPLPEAALAAASAPPAVEARLDAPPRVKPVASVELEAPPRPSRDAPALAPPSRGPLASRTDVIAPPPAPLGSGGPAAPRRPRPSAPATSEEVATRVSSDRRTSPSGITGAPPPVDVTAPMPSSAVSAALGPVPGPESSDRRATLRLPIDDSGSVWSSPSAAWEAPPSPAVSPEPPPREPERAAPEPPPGPRIERGYASRPSSPGKRSAMERVALFERARSNPLEPVCYRLLAEYFDGTEDPGRAALMRELSDALEGVPQPAFRPPPLMLTGADRLALKHPALRGEAGELVGLVGRALCSLYPTQGRNAGTQEVFSFSSGKGARAAADALAISVRVLGLMAPEVHLSADEGPPFSLVYLGQPRVLVGAVAVRRVLDAAELRFFAGRALFTQSAEMLPLRLLRREQLVKGLALVVEVARGQLDSTEARVLRDALPSTAWERVKALTSSVGSRLDVGQLAEGARHTANRAGLVVCGAVGPALAALKAKKALQPEITELVRFAASERYLQMRGRYVERSPGL